jgi:VIT1/CCC1 family predicted Fe2+/Mn2+ transporter
MPANKKYLSNSLSQKTGKITCATIGGYLISALMHMNFALWFSFHKEILGLGTFSVYFFWVILMLLPFLFKNAWHAWLTYLLTIVLLSVFYFYYPYNNPFL